MGIRLRWGFQSPGKAGGVHLSGPGMRIDLNANIGRAANRLNARIPVLNTLPCNILNLVSNTISNSFQSCLERVPGLEGGCELEVRPAVCGWFLKEFKKGATASDNSPPCLGSLSIWNTIPGPPSPSNQTKMNIF